MREAARLALVAYLSEGLHGSEQEQPLAEAFAEIGMPILMPGYCDECGGTNCRDPECQRTRRAVIRVDLEIEELNLILATLAPGDDLVDGLLRKLR